MKKILVINGPNLNLLGLREPALYGAKNFAALQQFICDCAAELSLEVELFQSNHEGVIVDKIQAAYGVFDGILINPAAYTHTSVAILDALKAVAVAKEEAKDVTYDVDVVVVGAGVAGLSAAISASAVATTISLTNLNSLTSPVRGIIISGLTFQSA